MKLYKTLILSICSLVALYLSSSCERDDICAEDTPTTPLLIIKFIDDETVSDIKQPVDLEVRSTDPLITNSLPNIVSRDSILIPLRTGSQITEFEFIINATNEDPNLVNSDVVSFQYTAVEEYVSTACGFRVSYEGLTRTLTQEENDGNWIKRITIEEDNVTDETAAHVFIFH
ncbi:DUF6452 family protein [Aquimarina sp. 2201CG14-23]|uniref:DUF6452 family protein n=1 Tax=Aquimarina mycalae TaxID=3040073 RepID=UPI002478016B|nr:DUF6452 family protein [Aquimarina sp. 2201CG14-23]MDH7446856.1 DUF6452 family protein [Aquimarina sp. 2201CG14-23]